MTATKIVFNPTSNTFTINDRVTYKLYSTVIPEVLFRNMSNSKVRLIGYSTYFSESTIQYTQFALLNNQNGFYYFAGSINEQEWLDIDELLVEAFVKHDISFTC